LSQMGRLTGARVLFPPGEGSPKGRMRAHFRPHPPLRGTLSQGERAFTKTGFFFGMKANPHSALVPVDLLKRNLDRSSLRPPLQFIAPRAAVRNPEAACDFSLPSRTLRRCGKAWLHQTA